MQVQASGLRGLRIRLRSAGDFFLRLAGRTTFPLRMGPLLRSVFRGYFRRAYISPKALHGIHIAHERGLPVYVLQDPSYLDVFCLSQRLESEGLRPIHLAPGLVGILYQPLKELARLLAVNIIFWFSRGRPPHALDDGEFRATLHDGNPIVLFLRMGLQKEWRWGGERRAILYGGKYFAVQEYLHSLLRLQRDSTRPIILIPHVPIWENKVVRVRRNLVDWIFGSLLAPRFWRRAAQIVLSRRKAELFFPETIDLQVFLAERSDRSPQEIVKELRKRLYRRFDETHLVVRGPKLPPRRELLNSILQDPLVRAAEDRFSAKQQGRQEDLEITVEPMLRKSPVKDAESRYALRYLREMAGDYKRWTIKFFEWVLETFMRRNCDGLVYDLGQLEKIREAIRRGSVLLLPNHRSHLDYFVISYILYHNKIMTPYICAGDNLNFFPAGPLFRRSGAYFIRRSFDESTLYPSVLNRYLRSLLRSRVVQELFIEGGRSRTGKMRPPMLGIFSLLTKGFFQGVCRDMFLVPISLSYDRVPEERAYSREMSGAAKRPESFKDLLAVWKLRRENFGRIYVSVGDPVSCREACAEAELDLENAREHAKRKLATSLAYRVSELQQHEQVLTPTGLLALILLAIYDDEGHEISRVEVIDLMEALVRLLDRRALSKPASRIRTFAMWEEIDVALERAIELFVREGILAKRAAAAPLRVCFENPAVAFLLDYYRNSVMHCFVSHAILATLVLSQTERGIDEKALWEGAKAIESMIDRDFPVRGEISLEGALEDLLHWRMVRLVDERGGKRLEVAHELRLEYRRLRQFGDTLRGLLQAHLVTAEFIRRWFVGEEVFAHEEQKESDLVRRILAAMDVALRPEARSWFNIVNALHHLADEKFLIMRNQRRRKIIFRTFTLAEEANMDVLNAHLARLRPLCAPLAPAVPVKHLTA